MDTTQNQNTTKPTSPASQGPGDNFSKPLSEPQIPQETTFSPDNPPLQNNPPYPPSLQNSSDESTVSPPQQEMPTSTASLLPPKKPRRGWLLAIVLILVLIILPITLAGTAYAIAYEKIKLEKYPELQTKIANLVIGLPFMPKTPLYVITQSAIAHRKVNKYSFDVSMAVDSASLMSALGVSKFDIEAKGWVDFSDPQNARVILETSLGKDFNLELRKNDPILYFKINKFPPWLLAPYGIESSHIEPLLDKWVAYDTTPLLTTARKAIKDVKDTETKPFTQEFYNQLNEKYLDEKILSNIKVEKIKENGIRFFKLSMDADSELIDYIGKKFKASSGAGASLQTQPEYKPSEFIKSLKWEILVEEGTYQVRKLSVITETEFDQGFYRGSLLGTSPNLSKDSKAITSLVIQLSDYGKDRLIEIPQEAMSFQEFTDLIAQMMRKVYASPEEKLASDDTKRKSDLLIISSALELFRIDCKKYPKSLSVLENPSKTADCPNVSKSYLIELPRNPDGSEYFYKVSPNFDSYDLCAKLDTPDPRYDTCPDKNYNYHVSNP